MSQRHLRAKGFLTASGALIPWPQLFRRPSGQLFAKDLGVMADIHREGLMNQKVSDAGRMLMLQRQLPEFAKELGRKPKPATKH